MTFRARFNPVKVSLTVALLALGCAAPAAAQTIAINEFRLSAAAASKQVNFIELKGTPGMSLSGFYLLLFDTNCKLSDVLALGPATIPAAQYDGSDPGLFVITNNATQYLYTHGRTAEKESPFASRRSGPVALRLVQQPVVLTLGTPCTNVGGTTWDAVAWTNVFMDSAASPGGEGREISPGLGDDQPGSEYRIYDTDSNQNFLDFAQGGYDSAGMSNFSNTPTCTMYVYGRRSSTVQLSWSSANQATSYRVKRCDASAGPCVPQLLSTTSIRPFNDAVMNDGADYWYLVTAADGPCAAGN